MGIKQRLSPEGAVDGETKNSACAQAVVPSEGRWPMGFLDSLKAKIGPAKEKVSDFAQQHGGKIEQGLDKAARTVDEKTKGKYSDKIGSGTGKAKDALGKLTHKDDGTPPPPASS
ncbi:antitoxin [Streptomyces sp. NRRL F-5135]|uniref:antitoxin n=2 Tax=unclassified Streptomyces TaxID=2593676 RepID=UPI001F2D3593